MPRYVGLDVSQKTTAICVVDEQGRRLWRGACATDPEAISVRVLRHTGVDVKVGVETGSMTPWLVHGLRSTGLDVECLDARRVRAALQMRLNKTDENDAEGLAQIMRMGWYRPGPREVPQCASRASSPRSSCSARGHDAALQHDARCAEDLWLAARRRSGAQI